MLTLLSSVVSELLDIFGGVFATVTQPTVLPWIILGVAIPVLSFLVGLFKRIVWGRN